MLEKQSQSSVRLNNLQLILKTIIAHEPLSRADLVRLTRISKPTVSNLIEDLLHKNLVLEVGQGASKTGRKPILLRFNATLKYFMVFTIGREDFHVALSDLKGEIISQQTGLFPRPQSPQDRLQELQTMMTKLLENENIRPADLLKIHGAAPGVFVAQGEPLTWSDHGFPQQADLQAYLEDRFDTEVILSHSSKISLFGERIAGQAQDVNHAIYIDFGYGLGSAFMFDGRIYFGANNSAGEIGYVYSGLKEFGGYSLNPFGWGALETIISGRSLKKKGMEAALRHPDCLIAALVGDRTEQITAKTVIEAARQGDQQAFYILKEAFAYFNMWLCNMINTLNPERVIIGGGISNAGEFLFDFIIDEIRDKVLILPEFTISELKDTATVIGAIAYLREQTDFFTEL